MIVANAVAATAGGLAVLYGAFVLAVRWGFRAPRTEPRRSPGDFQLPFETVAITTAHGRQLCAWFVPPPSPPAPAVILMHGWGGNADNLLPLAPHLHAAGLGVLLLEARGHGASEGDGFSSMPKFAEDLGSAIDWVTRRADTDPDAVGLAGHSVGAAAALLAATRDSRVGAVASLASFAHPAELMGRIMRARGILARPLRRWVLAYIERKIGASYEEIAPLNTIRHISAPVLLIHGDADDRVPLKDARAIYAQRTSDAVQLWTLPGTGHDSFAALHRHGPRLASFFHDTLLAGRAP